MHESTQLNGTSIVPTPPPHPDCWYAAAQRTGTSLFNAYSRTQQLKGLALVHPLYIRAHCGEVAEQRNM